MNMMRGVRRKKREMLFMRIVCCHRRIKCKYTQWNEDNTTEKKRQNVELYVYYGVAMQSSYTQSIGSSQCLFLMLAVYFQIVPISIKKYICWTVVAAARRTHVLCT